MNEVIVLEKIIGEILKRTIVLDRHIQNRGTFSDIGFTSLMFVQFLVKVETQFQIEIADTVLEAGLSNTIDGFLKVVKDEVTTRESP